MSLIYFLRHWSLGEVTEQCFCSGVQSYKFRTTVSYWVGQLPIPKTSVMRKYEKNSNFHSYFVIYTIVQIYSINVESLISKRFRGISPLICQYKLYRYTYCCKLHLQHIFAVLLCFNKSFFMKELLAWLTIHSSGSRLFNRLDVT